MVSFRRDGLKYIATLGGTLDDGAAEPTVIHESSMISPAIAASSRISPWSGRKKHKRFERCCAAMSATRHAWNKCDGRRR